VAVSEDGRITPASPGLYADDQLEAWRRIVGHIHEETPAKTMVRLGHAGPRGATRPRRDGVDRPLREGWWPLLAASPIPYTPRSQTPNAIDPDDIGRVIGDFEGAARRAAEAGFDALLLDFGHGYLPATFISPLTNRRADHYAGSLDRRMRFPCELIDAVRRVWPEDRALGVALTVTDWFPGGIEPEEAVAAVRLLKERGCDVVQVLAGHTTWRSRPEYGRMFLVPFSDRIRNEVGVATIVGGAITTYDEVDTILAAGRADLCILDVPVT
jgi:anthraniloyl-CoA monooxygenase